MLVAIFIYINKWDKSKTIKVNVQILFLYQRCEQPSFADSGSSFQIPRKQPPPFILATYNASATDTMHL